MHRTIYRTTNIELAGLGILAKNHWTIYSTRFCAPDPLQDSVLCAPDLLQDSILCTGPATGTSRPMATSSGRVMATSTLEGGLVPPKRGRSNQYPGGLATVGGTVLHWTRPVRHPGVTF
jgi:hypothetical protein